MTKRKPPQPDMNTFPDEHSQPDRLAHITKENDMKSPTHIVDGEYINEWLVLGPFFPDDLETDFLTDVGGEANIEPQEGDTARSLFATLSLELATSLALGVTSATVDRRTLTWKRYQAKGNIVDLADAIGNYEHATAYAFCVLQTPTHDFVLAQSDVPTDVQIHLGSDDSVAVWINGQLAHHNTVSSRSVPLDEDMFEAGLKAGANRCLLKVSRGIGDWGFAVRMDALSPNRAVLSGVITDEAGQPIPSAAVRMEQVEHSEIPSIGDKEEIAQTTTDDSGRYRLNIHPMRGQYDLFATSGDLGDRCLGIRLDEGESRTLNLTLKEAVNIEGTLLMLDDTTPHVAIPVQAIRSSSDAEGEPTVVATVLSDESGKYQFINLKPGQCQVRCQILGGYVYFNRQLTIDNRQLKGIDFRFAPFKKGTWKNYTYLDGLADNHVLAIHRNPDGRMWFGTFGGGVSVYDGKMFKNFTTEDGLAHNSVLSIHRDPDGVMWFGTSGGVSRYDGKEFVNLTTEDGLAHNRVSAIHCAPDGVLWFGTNGGVSRYDRKEFLNFTTEDGLANNFVRCISCNPDGTLWFGTDGGISRGVYPFDKQCHSARSNDFVELAKNLAGSELMRRDGSGFVNFTIEDGLANNVIWSIYRDHDGMMWFGTEGGVSRYDGKEFSNFTTEDGLANNDVRHIHCDPDGTLWFGTFGGGVSRYAPLQSSITKGGSKGGFVNFAAADGLSNHVYAIHRDEDGAMWFGTLSDGVFRYDEKEFLTFTTKDGLASNDVPAIHRAPDGMLWFGTYGGVSVYDGKGFVNFTTKDGLVHNWVCASHCTPDGVMWFGTGSGGISRYDGKEFVNFTTKDGLVHNIVWAIHGDPDGVMWFGTDGGGVSRYDGKEFVNFTTENGLASNAVNAIHCDPDGVTWFGTGGGVLRYDGKEFVNFTTEDGLAYNGVSVIHRAPDGTLWFGTDGGVSHYAPPRSPLTKGGSKGGFVNFTTQDGLVNNKVNAIYAASNGMLWFGTFGGGVAAYDGIAWTSLDTRDGLASNVVQSIHPDADDSLWFATQGGITRYRRSTTPPQVHIVSVTADQTYRDLDAIPALTIGTRVTIEYNSIDFLTVPEKRQYRTRVTNNVIPSTSSGQALSEVEGSELRITNQNQQSEIQNPYNPPTKEITFDWIPEKPGDYIFEVQAIDRDLNYSEPISLTLKVGEQPYLEELRQTREQLEAAYRDLRARNAELQVAKEAAEEARETAEFANRAKSIFLANMSHEIRTPLNAILGYAQILQRNPDLQPEALNSVSTIENSGKHLLELINDILDLSKIEVGRMEVQNADFDLTALIDGLSVMFQLRCQQKRLGWRVEWLVEHEKPLRPSTSLRAASLFNGQAARSTSRILVHGDEGKLRQVLLNLLANAVKFTDSGEVILRISNESNAHPLTFRGRSILFEIIDTGVGIPPEDQESIFEPFQQGKESATKGGTGLGLTIAQKQVELMGGQLDFESPLSLTLTPKEVGSRFFFTLPFSPAKSEVPPPSAEVERAVVHLAEGYQVKALVADDVQENRDVLAKLLSDIGVEVITAEDGSQAVEMVRSHRPDIVFMDIWMPVMDGLEATKQILSELWEGAPVPDNRDQEVAPTVKEHSPTVKMVAISASALTHERESYLEIGFDAFIAKPFLAEEIYGCLASLLHIEYEYKDVGVKHAVPLELSKLKLSEDILRRLKEAAERYSTTQLKSCLNELENYGQDGHCLAEHLRRYLLNYDMEGILKVLSGINSK